MNDIIRKDTVSEFFLDAKKKYNFEFGSICIALLPDLAECSG